MQRLFLIATFAALGANAVRVKMSPVTRVVDLLKSLSVQIEADGKKEETLYQAYVCWGKSLISEKTASNAASASRIDMLNTYIADLDAGRIELTTERTELEKELETIAGDMEVSTDIRNKEKADFDLAKGELNQGIAALNEAIEVLKTTTAGHEEGVFLRMRGTVQSRTQVEQSAGLTRAVELGNKILTKGDALFLQRLLTGEVPSWDWKKLNRKATFKMSYKKRSSKIQDVLAQLLETFQSNLNDADKKEKDAQDTFDKLMAAKVNQKMAAQDALAKMAEENGAKGVSRNDAATEVALLTKQVTDDKKYIGELQTALNDKKTQWQERLSLRAGELEAISKAIAILHGDDARDTFKKSFQSQGYSLLQQSSTSLTRRVSYASAMLRATGHASHDERLVALAASMAAGNTTGQFDDVVTAIGNMLIRLQGEETDDLQKKETCDADRMTDTREAMVESRTIDEATELMNRLTAEVEELVQEIQVTNDKVKGIENEILEITNLRMAEMAAHGIAKKDDEDAAKLVLDAQAVLKTFYKDKLGKDLGLTQKKQQQPGAAPPPPPATWEEPYGGKSMESHGILSVLTMIHDDILADIAKADKEEAEATAIWTTSLNALETENGRVKALRTVMQGSKADKEQKKSDTSQLRKASKITLDIVMKKIKDAESGCNYFVVKYPLRHRNRQIEIDGLIKARAILKGARFATPVDPNREVKPGDALLQTTH